MYVSQCKWEDFNQNVQYPFSEADILLLPLHIAYHLTEIWISLFSHEEKLFLKTQWFLFYFTSFQLYTEPISLQITIQLYSKIELENFCLYWDDSYKPIFSFVFNWWRRRIKVIDEEVKKCSIMYFQKLFNGRPAMYQVFMST